MKFLSYTFTKIVVFYSLGLSAQAQNPELASPEDLERFKEAKWNNEDAVALSVSFFNHTKDPYPKNWKGYNVDIDYSMNCHLVFLNEDRTIYDMVEATAGNVPESPYGSFVTHTGPCGVCSGLQDLAVYIEKTDLTTPVSRCAKMLIPKNKKKCLRDLGFSERCLMIWYWNTVFTRKGCLNICLRYQHSARNQPFGNYNPCKPVEGHLPGLEEDPDLEANEGNADDSRLTLPPLTPQTDQEFGASATTLPSLDRGGSTGGMSKAKSIRKKLSSFSSKFATSFDDKSMISLFKRKKKTVGCRNSINHQAACKDYQWQNNEQRLNPCLQCDECKSGPMFQKVSGRQRRNSGVVSAIGRQNVVKLDHHYYTGYQNIKDEL